MVALLSLWLPILLSAVAVFVVSSVIHMMLGYHAGDIRPVPAEDEFMETLRRLDLPPDDYAVPHASSMEAMKDPDYLQKLERGPVVFMTVLPGRDASMARTLAAWFGYAVVVSIVAGYITSRALAPGADYLEVFRFAGATAFFAYALGGWPESIWWGRKWSTTLKNTFDGLLYGLVTGGMFGWLWP